MSTRISAEGAFITRNGNSSRDKRGGAGATSNYCTFLNSPDNEDPERGINWHFLGLKTYGRLVAGN